VHLRPRPCERVPRHHGAPTSQRSGGRLAQGRFISSQRSRPRPLRHLLGNDDRIGGVGAHGHLGVHSQSASAGRRPAQRDRAAEASSHQGSAKPVDSQAAAAVHAPCRDRAHAVHTQVSQMTGIGYTPRIAARYGRTRRPHLWQSWPRAARASLVRFCQPPATLWIKSRGGLPLRPRLPPSPPRCSAAASLADPPPSLADPPTSLADAPTSLADPPCPGDTAWLGMQLALTLTLTLTLTQP
jgi:hypothetical protein